MSLEKDGTIAKLQSHLLLDLREEISDGDASYDEQIVRTLEGILVNYLIAMETANDKEAALKHTREAVQSINVLNDQCGGELIETMRREDICAIVSRAGVLRETQTADEDLTEEWRTW